MHPNAQDRHQWPNQYQNKTWLKPYAKNTLINWGNEGIKNVQVICPGFSADCLETLEEIKVENRDYFINAGGEKFDYIPALNDGIDHIGMMGQLIKQHASDWLNIDKKEMSQN